MRLVVASKPITDFERRRKNIAASKSYPLFKPQEGTTGPVAMCAAGPSLLKSLPLLRAYYRAGIPICAIKGAASVLILHGIIPKYAVFLDSREDQLRLVQETHPDTIYCLGSQIDPSLFEKLAGCDIRVFHASSPKLHTEPNTDYITGGSTTGLRAINLMRWAGYTKFFFLGYDCCLIDGVSHIYSKTNTSQELTVMVGGREFETTAELACQHQDFIKLHVAIDEPLDAIVHGDGALARSFQMIEEGRHDDVWMHVDQFTYGLQFHKLLTPEDTREFLRPDPQENFVCQ